jgi:hypothetical protein
MGVGPQKIARWPGKSQTKNARGPSKKMQDGRAEVKRKI